MAAAAKVESPSEESLTSQEVHGLKQSHPEQKKEVEGEGEALELFNPGNQTQPIQIGSWNQAFWLLVLLAFNSKQATV